MIYKLIVNAAFLAIGYYIGKEVGRGESTRKETPKESKDTGTHVIDDKIQKNIKSDN